MRVLSPHLTASPGAYSPGEVIFSTAHFDAEDFSVVDFIQFLSLFNVPLATNRELFASV